MVLTPKQQRIVEENMGLVGKVIKDKVHGIGQQGVFTYEELFQIGCLAYVRRRLQIRAAASLPMPTD